MLAPRVETAIVLVVALGDKATSAAGSPADDFAQALVAPARRQVGIGAGAEEDALLTYEITGHWRFIPG